MAADGELARFKPFQTLIEATFFKTLADRKLQEWKLDVRPRRIVGRWVPAVRADVAGVMRLDGQAFDASDTDASASPAGDDRFSPRIAGLLTNTNTLDDLKAMDKAALLTAAGQAVWASIVSGEALSDPSLLATFTLLTFADIKRHKFVHWCGMPVVLPSEAWSIRQRSCDPAPFALAARWGLEATDICSQVDEALEALRSRSPGNCLPLAFALECAKTGSDASSEAGGVRALHLKDVASPLEAGVVLCVLDNCELPNHGGWVARNLALLAAARWGLRSVSIVCIRPSPRGGLVAPISASDSSDPRRHAGSVLLTLDLPPLEVDDMTDLALPESARVVGWELHGGAARPAVTDLSSLLDPTRLAEAAGRLNVSLMRWRALPELQQDRLEGLRCLLLGAGTLGCYVARSLLAWGVRSITLVDSGSVAHSNPVRQPLFEFADVAGADGPKRKAEAAASALKRISPVADSTGVILRIPMPGHAEDVPGSLAAAAELHRLCESHDVVFALTDTRESRWLPTVICQSLSRPLINVALGFDSFLVMRHGIPEGTAGPHLGCYFCQDIVAPLDSSKGRTLDQECTVTRPGLAPMAAASAVELLVNTLHHPDGFRAAADADAASSDDGVEESHSSPLGLVPHQVRGFAGRFQSLVLHGMPFHMCTACCPAIVDRYTAGGATRDSLLRSAFETPLSLEEMSGLTAMKAAAEAATASADSDEAADDDDDW